MLRSPFVSTEGVAKKRRSRLWPVTFDSQPRLYPNGRFRYPQQRPINHTALFPCYTLVKFILKLYISKELDL